MARYTAQEMREAADNFWVGGVICEVKDKDGRVVKHIKHDAVIAMLRQAADALEREEKREKRYEYGLKSEGGFISRHHSYSFYEEYQRKSERETVLRREVGEWEEVKDGE